MSAMGCVYVLIFAYLDVFQKEGSLQYLQLSVLSDTLSRCDAPVRWPSSALYTRDRERSGTHSRPRDLPARKQSTEVLITSIVYLLLEKNTIAINLSLHLTFFPPKQLTLNLRFFCVIKGHYVIGCLCQGRWGSNPESFGWQSLSL